ncbi:MAG: alanine--tRNA ligase [Methanomicrobiales archaeon]
MLEDEYLLDYFRDHGLERRVCTSCGGSFWTRDPERTLCGDAPCEPYQFIGNPVLRPHTLDEMREAFLSFFERNGHARIERYPVVARWRDDIYLTIASIADFQPFVTSGVVPPPANPLTISQPCIRLNDLDSVGRSGRHLTLFEMMAHHAFNTDLHEVYWKDRTVALCDEFLASAGADLVRVTYKEHPWIGGGNAGPSVEVLIGGLEVATLVFMNLGRIRTGKPPVMLGGEAYYPMKTRIVDTGYGLERLAWASQGSPTVYDAVFPEILPRLMEAAGLGEAYRDPGYRRILGESARFAGLMDIHGSNLLEMRKKVAASIGVPVGVLEEKILPVERIYAIADHTRCLAYMLGDCIVPSNVREGYLARLVIRRTLRMMHDLGLDLDLADLVDRQMEIAGKDGFVQEDQVVREIVGREVERYRQTLERGGRIVQRIAGTYRSRKEPIPLAEVITLYDSHGIPPETVKDLAEKEGVGADVPDDFYSRIADLHAGEARSSEDPLEKYRERTRELPPTRPLYYEAGGEMEFEATVLDNFDGFVVMDATLFYPEGGGQPSDTGTLVTAEGISRVESVVKLGEVILHQTTGGVIKKGERVKGKLDEERRLSLMRHHTGTHILLHAAKVVLGSHIHQAGAQKGSESSRLDIRHFKHITPEELAKIEVEANRMVMMDIPVYIRWEERDKAEQKFGFDLYQGGVPPGREIRVVQVDGEVQACAGTHCHSTGEVGAIKVIRVEHIQDGVERLEFAAGIAALYHMQRVEKLLSEASGVLSVQPENLPTSSARFFGEWKERGKEVERLRARLAELEARAAKPEMVKGVPVLVRRIDLAPRDLVALAREVAEKGGIAVLAGGSGPVHVAGASGMEGVSAAELVAKVCAALGGKGGGSPAKAQGGGPDAGAIGEALALAMKEIREALHD